MAAVVYSSTSASKVVHHINCPAVRHISMANLRSFKSEADARRAGYRLCRCSESEMYWNRAPRYGMRLAGN